MDIPTISRPSRKIVDGLAAIGTATLCGEISKIGIRDAQIRGPLPFQQGVTMAGPALTLQFMPKREDVYDIDEYADPEAQMHRQVLYQVEEGDVVVVDARGDMASGVFGEMMLTYMQGRGGAGLVIDGCIRDTAKARAIGLPMWVRGSAPGFHTQLDIFPFAVNVPVACGGRLVMPGDIIVADDDGAVVVPVAMAEALLARAGEHAEWEEFSRLKLAEGADLRRYYPLHSSAQDEFDRWREGQGGASAS